MNSPGLNRVQCLSGNSDSRGGVLKTIPFPAIARPTGLGYCLSLIITDYVDNGEPGG